MIRKSKMLSVLFLFLCVFGLIGCSAKDTEKKDDLISTKNMELVYEETISPNKESVENEKDIVNYIVEVYQDKDNVIIVHSKSNSEFFKPIQYKLKFDTNITKDDIDIEWTTGMGNSTPTEDNQLCIAYVSISEKGKVVSKRKISFVNKGIEIIEETLKM